MSLKPCDGGAAEPVWFKSSYSGSNNNDCVEVAWFKSSYSGSDNNDCVEIAATTGTIRVRDSKDPHGPQLAFSPEAWADFVRFAATF
ncbi:DUF397 domain-containing protein [Streptomyces pactum]|uniref:DUF397 domain-containing protein n=1 Tax=Streptomyces pactum TaxID=68249 RepID=A0ABS0NJP1_9ACTN|nr:DUF397 domain-containing protein [Streptomyces pactum]MBH5335413.1 DUF397 domain-containing protein [Streptomyces pactum]